jgi:hypothetical protein
VREIINGVPSPLIPTNFRGLTFQWYSDLPGATGNSAGVFLETNGQALASYVGGRAPAQWTVYWGGYGGPLPETIDEQVADNCGPTGPTGISDYTTGPIFSTGINPIACNYVQGGGVILGAGGFGFSPTPAYVSAPPSSGTVYGSGFSTTHGMPMLQYFNLNGTYVTQENASYVSPDGTVLTVPGGSLSTLPNGTYAGLVNNINADGSLNYIGAAQAEIAVTIPLYRYRNVSDNDYFYQTVYSTPGGYVYEGVASYLFTAQMADTLPLYRLYSPGLNMHFYTDSYNEMYNCVYYYGWRYEGIPGYIALTQINGTTPLYRLSKNNGSHLFTTNWAEVQNAARYYGFVYEGVAGYVPMQ